MDAATIYYVGTDSASWAEYLKTKLAEEEYNIPTILCDVANSDEQHKSAKLNILLVSPEFVELESWNHFRDLDSQKSMAVLLNITTKEFGLICNEHRHCPELLEWRVDSMEATDDSVRHLLLSIIRIYEGLDSDESGDDETLITPTPSNISPGNAQTEFHLETEEDPIYDVPPCSREKNKLHQVIHDDEDRKTVFILLDQEADNDVDIINEGSSETKAEYVSKSVYRFRIPDETHVSGDGSFNFSVYSGTQNLGQGEVKCGSKLELLRKLLADELSPISLLCQAMGTPRGDLEALDAKMSQTIKQWRPLRFMQHFEGPVASIEGQTKCPTLLHFGAQYHLENFCRELINYPGMVAACVTLNSDGDYPNDIARREGFVDLANELECFVKEYANSTGSSPRNCDSGVVGDAPPPTPHPCGSHKSDYVSMQGTNDDDDKPPLPPRNSVEHQTEDDYVDMTNISDVTKHKEARRSCSSPSHTNSPHVHRRPHHSHSGHSSSHERHVSGPHRHSDSPQLSRRHRNTSGHSSRTGSHGLDRELDLPSTPCSSRPGSEVFSSSPCSSALSSSPSSHNRLLIIAYPEKHEKSEVISPPVVDETTHEDESSKQIKMSKGMRRSSSGNLAKKISNFLTRLKKPGRKMSVPDLSINLREIQRNSSTKFYTRNPADRTFDDKGSRPNSSDSTPSSCNTRPNSLESERDSGSFDGEDSSEQLSHKLKTSVQLSPVLIPVISPRRPPLPLNRQKSVRINNAINDNNVFAPPLPERRPLKHDCS